MTSPEKVLSIDVGTTNLGVWIGYYQTPSSPSSYELPFITEYWRRINLHASSATLATYNMVTKFLKHHSEFYDPAIRYVVIESQENSTEIMQRLSNALQAHFLTVSIMKNTETQVHFEYGSGKLKVYTDPNGIQAIMDRMNPRLQRSNNQHRKNKWIAEQHCHALLLQQSLENQNRWIPWFTSLDKKDDVADAYLQGCYFLKKMYDPTFLRRPQKKRKENPPSITCDIVVTPDT